MAEENVELESLFPQEQPVSTPAVATDESSPAYEVSQQRVSDIDAERQRFRDSFDVGGATLAGYDDKQILDYVLGVYPNPRGVAGNREAYQKAKAAGHSDSDILATLTGARSPSAVGAIAEGISKGVTEMGPVAAGGVMGFKIGAELSPFVAGVSGPFAPVTVPTFIGLTTAGGAASGYLFGDTASDLIFPEEPLTPSKRPFRESGYTFGAGLTFPLGIQASALKFVPGTFSFSRNVARMNGRLTPIERIQQTAIERPGAFLRTEGASLGGASTGAFLAEKKDPGDATTRLLAEVGLGTLSPVALADTTISFVKNKVLDVSRAFTETGRQTRQGNALVKFFKENGEDPEAVLKALQNPDQISALATSMGIDIGPRTTASVTGSPAFLKLQNTLAQDKAYGPTIRNALRKNNEGMANLIDLMAESGDPTLISKAASLRKDFMRGVIIQRLDDINAAAIRLNQKTAPDSPTARMQAGRVIEGLTDQAIKQMRETESNLYTAVNGAEEIDASNLVEAYRAMEDELIELGVAIPSSVRNIVGKASGESIEVAEANLEKITRINTRIDKADDKISAIRASNPDSVEAVNSLVSTDNPLEQQLVQIQDAIRTLEADDALTRLGIKSPERNRRLTVLRNQAQIINGRLEINDIQAAKAVPPEGFDTTITLGEMMNARSKLLTLGRSLTANNNFQPAHFVSDLANAIVDDFGIRVADDVELSANQQALRDAHDFSVALNDVFSRAFPGVILARNKSGARRIMPELLSAATFRGGGDATSLRYDQMSDAMNFAAQNAGKEFSDTVAGQIGTMRSNHETLMRAAFEDLVDPTTGRVTQEKLDQFTAKYRNALFTEDGKSKFPAFTADLASVAKAENMLETRLRLTGDPRFAEPGANLKISVDGKSFGLGSRAPEGLIHGALKDEISFLNSIGSDTNPVKLIAATIGSPDSRPDNAVKGLRTLVRNTRSAEAKFPGAMNGLRDMILDRAITFASDVDANGDQILDFARFNKFLNQPIARGQPSPLEILRQEGVVDDGFAVRMNTLLSEGANTQRALVAARSGDAETVKLPQPSLDRAVTNLITIVSLRAGRFATQKAPGSGQGLAEPSMAAREASDIFIDVPNIQQDKLLIRAALEPDFFKLLMESAKPGTRRYVQRNQRLRAYLTNAGLIGATAEQRYNEERAKRESDAIGAAPVLSPPSATDASVVPISPNVAPGLVTVDEARAQIPAQPVAPPTTTLASVSPSMNPVGQGSVNRSRFAALFPEDRALIEGIGSLG